MKTMTSTALLVALLLAGFAVGVPVGKSKGFKAGSEWALMQADIVAREAGVFMPVYLDDGAFRVVIKQPRNFYRRAWQLADQHYDEIQGLQRGQEVQREIALVKQ
jgi:hypothetical protein